jgi:hypothetical protein
MQGWIVAGSWIFAVMFSVVILGFSCFELTWKTRRARADGDKLHRVVSELTAVTADLVAAADRAKLIRASAGPLGPAEQHVS